ncbi:MAG: lipoprotein signal peptidase [Gemmatales bacterium]|nr:MAG: lipoprotein signal peptidase [Gemmatales bacterium]
MHKQSFRGLLWTLALIGLTVDVSSKYVVFHWLYNEGRGGEYVVIPGMFEFLAQFTPEEDAGDDILSSLRTLSGRHLPRVNHGALFGFAGSTGSIANTVFAVISALAAVAIIYWSTLPTTVRDLPLSASLGLILGGTLGNLFDRVVFNGVRDFIHWHFKDQFDWPVFNIADCCLVCGAFLLLVQAYWQTGAAEGEAAEEASTAISKVA